MQGVPHMVKYRLGSTYMVKRSHEDVFEDVCGMWMFPNAIAFVRNARRTCAHHQHWT